MFSAEDYLQGWIVYSIGVACILLFLWLVMKKSAWTTLRHLILLLCASVLLTPVTAYRDDSHLAPAFLSASTRGSCSRMLIWVSSGPGTDYCVALFAVIFYGLLRLLWRRLGRASPAKKTALKGATKGRSIKELKAEPHQYLQSRPVLIFLCLSNPEVKPCGHNGFVAALSFSLLFKACFYKNQ